MNRYRDLAQARASIGHFLEQIYNRRRLHSSLGYVPPVELKPGWRQESGVSRGGCGMGFLRHEKIYRSDGEARSGGWAAPGAHRFDEFPAGYSLAGCSPAEPASASPAGYSIGEKDGAGNLFPANGNLSLFTLSHDRGAAQSVTDIPVTDIPTDIPGMYKCNTLKINRRCLKAFSNPIMILKGVWTGEGTGWVVISFLVRGLRLVGPQRARRATEGPTRRRGPGAEWFHQRERHWASSFLLTACMRRAHSVSLSRCACCSIKAARMPSFK